MTRGRTVGELAEATGLSVRVLRHWDQRGVVSPSRTPAGHRLYDADDVVRLHRAITLRALGLRLDQVAALLDGADPDPAATLRAHLAGVDADLRRRQVVRDRLAEVLDRPGDDVLSTVIREMTMVGSYVHGYHDTEAARLRDQAATLADLLHEGVAFADGAHVLEPGCGVGAQTVVLAARSPGARFTSIDLEPGQVAAARARVAAAGLADRVDVRAGDVHAPPVAAGSIDDVVVFFLLEHLPRPDEALRALRRVLRPGGTITVVEGDHGATAFHPDSADARAVIACQEVLQRHAGGDAGIGRRLHPLLTAAGFDDVDVVPRTAHAHAGRPDLADALVRRTFTAMVAGVREPALAAGLITPERFDAGVRDLLRTTEPGGTFSYTFFRATGTRAASTTSVTPTNPSRA
ncbi:methyltransferase domain-containing protein [Actinomycetospora cinnamomea]|uniref:DNA-binding transcriptional MerR regulator n=1 Tax=Actinomycetospora cinnamomea TaxID=663609 RepID=A0A2U1FL32_9PSEU|nr:methyltransferase domain-containing protein [Actinomycetospora cinnamomea]PVZ12869.1 DNA-binding transcriptional MerR regulator [Actinomycetospora cinnamomea]